MNLIHMYFNCNIKRILLIEKREFVLKKIFKRVILNFSITKIVKVHLKILIFEKTLVLSPF